MLKLLVASLATASALKVKSQPAVKPLSNALKLRGGVSAADVAHYGQLFLCERRNEHHSACPFTNTHHYT